MDFDDDVKRREWSEMVIVHEAASERIHPQLAYAGTFHFVYHPVGRVQCLFATMLHRICIALDDADLRRNGSDDTGADPVSVAMTAIVLPHIARKQWPLPLTSCQHAAIGRRIMKLLAANKVQKYGDLCAVARTLVQWQPHAWIFVVSLRIHELCNALHEMEDNPEAAVVSYTHGMSRVVDMMHAVWLPNEDVCAGQRLEAAILHHAGHLASSASTVKPAARRVLLKQQDERHGSDADLFAWHVVAATVSEAFPMPELVLAFPASVTAEFVEWWCTDAALHGIIAACGCTSIHCADILRHVMKWEPKIAKQISKCATKRACQECLSANKDKLIAKWAKCAAKSVWTYELEGAPRMSGGAVALASASNVISYMAKLAPLRCHPICFYDMFMKHVWKNRCKHWKAVIATMFPPRPPSARAVTDARRAPVASSLECAQTSLTAAGDALVKSILGDGHSEVVGSSVAPITSTASKMHLAFRVRKRARVHVA